MSNELDRMLADNQNSTRMNQAKQIAKITAEVAMLAVGGAGKKALSKAAGSLKPALSTGAKAGYDTLGKRVFNKAKLVLKEGAPALKKGAKMVGKVGLEQGKSKVEDKIKEQLPAEVQQVLELKEKIDKVKGILGSFEGAITRGSNGKIDAAAKVVLGEGDLTHGVIGYTDKVLKAAEGKPNAYALKVIEGGQKQLDHMIGQTTKDLLKDTAKMLESAKKDIDEEVKDDWESGSEIAIREMRKA